MVSAAVPVTRTISRVGSVRANLQSAEGSKIARIFTGEVFKSTVALQVTGAIAGGYRVFVRYATTQSDSS